MLSNLITVGEAVQAIEALDPSDPEKAHDLADDILLASVPEEVRAAYKRLVKRAGWWATA